MIRLFGAQRSSAGRCRWLLEELGVPYETVRTAPREGAEKHPEFFAENPFATIPFLIDPAFQRASQAW